MANQQVFKLSTWMFPLCIHCHNLSQLCITILESESNNDGEWIKKLRPSVHCSINKGRLLFGNQITERTLVVYFDHAEGQYVMNRVSYYNSITNVCSHSS